SWKGEEWEVRAIGIEYGAYSVEPLRFTTFGYFDRSSASPGYVYDLWEFCNILIEAVPVQD
ncbi:32404_t:CDS:2, partial [Gigaspora margarita]